MTNKDSLELEALKKGLQELIDFYDSGVICSGRELIAAIKILLVRSKYR
jgi:hypothetical protein